MFHGEDPPDVLLEKLRLFHQSLLHFFQLALTDLLQVVIQPEPTNGLVAIVQLSEVHLSQSLLGKTTVVDHERVGRERVEDVAREVATDAVKEHTPAFELGL